MDRKGTFIIAGAILLGMGTVAGTQFAGQRDARPESMTQPAQAAEPLRYQVVSVKESEIILLDVITGDLYTAKPQDLKSFDMRPGGGPGPKARSA